MIRFDIEPGASAPLCHYRPGVLAAWALLLSALYLGSEGLPRSEAKVALVVHASAEDHSTADRGVLQISKYGADGSRDLAMNTLGDPMCQCQAIDRWRCSEDRNVQANCSCRASNLVVTNSSGVTVKPPGDYSCASLIRECLFECSDYDLFCNNGTCSCASPDGDTFCSAFDLRMQFMTAAQIALGAALVVAVLALAVLVWKMCYRPGQGICPWRLGRGGIFWGMPYSSRARGGGSGEDEDGSTNSIQNFVIQKMRDRPPRYEDAPPEMPPCYDEVIGRPPWADPPSTRDSTASWRRGGGDEAAPPYEAHDPARRRARPTGRRRRGARLPRGRPAEDVHTAASQVRARDMNNDYSDHSVNISTGSQCSIIQVSSTVSDEVVNEGLDNPAFVREIYEHHL